MIKLDYNNLYEFIKRTPQVYDVIKTGMDCIEEHKLNLLYMITSYEINFQLSQRLISNTVNETKSFESLYLKPTKGYMINFKNARLENEDSLYTHKIYLYISNYLLLLDNLLFITGKHILVTIVREDGSEHEEILNEVVYKLSTDEYKELYITSCRFNVMNTKKVVNNMVEELKMLEPKEKIKFEKLSETERIKKFDTFKERLENVNSIDELLDII